MPTSTRAQALAPVEIFNYNARVYSDQPTPPAATYSDSVILDVQF